MAALLTVDIPDLPDAVRLPAPAPEHPTSKQIIQLTDKVVKRSTQGALYTKSTSLGNLRDGSQFIVDIRFAKI